MPKNPDHVGTLPELLSRLYGPAKASRLATESKDAFAGRELFENYLAIFCNVAGEISGDTEFDRGVEEGKRRVWLEIARLRRLRPSDFQTIANGENLYNE